MFLSKQEKGHEGQGKVKTLTMKPKRKTVTEVRSLIEKLAFQRTPGVWIGREGLTLAEWLQSQVQHPLLQDGFLFELVGNGRPWSMESLLKLNAIDVIGHLSDEMDRYNLINLWDEVVSIHLAKHCKVLLSADYPETYEERFEPIGRSLPVDELSRESADLVLSNLRFLAQEDRPPYVVPETKRTIGAMLERGPYLE